MILLSLPVEILLHVGSYLSRNDQISLATTSMGIRRIFMILILGGTVYIRSPLVDVDIYELFNPLHDGTPDIQSCVDQLKFYRQHSDLARSVHTVKLTDWVAAGEMAKRAIDDDAILRELKNNQAYCLDALSMFHIAYDIIVVYLIQLLPISELQLIRSHITQTMHRTLHTMPKLRRLTLDGCTAERLDYDTDAGHGGQYESLKVIAEQQTHLKWTDPSGPYTMGEFVQACLSNGSRLTKLEVCIRFLWNALDHLSLPSLTSLTIVIDTPMWSWRTVYRILKISPNITCFKFIARDASYLGSEFHWQEYKRMIGNLPLSQLSSITAYRKLVKRLVPRRPVSFVEILLYPDMTDPEINLNWPDPESDDEVNDDISYLKERYIVPHQLVRSATPIKTLYLRRIKDEVELDAAKWAEGLEFLRDACPYLTDLWLPSESLKTTSRRSHYRDPEAMVEVLDELRIWDEMTLERCAVDPCSPCLAKELAWYREGIILPERVHPTLKELLLGADVWWKWHNDSKVTGWVLYTTTDIEGR